MRSKAFILAIAVLGVMLGYFWTRNRAEISNSPKLSTVRTLNEANEQETSPTVALKPQLKEPESIARTQLRTLESILDSKNDNDSRLDTELRSLDDEAKNAFRSKYRTLPDEDRNGRGTIVFLVGRNLNDASDFEFLDEVLKERPCLSLADCRKNSGNAYSEEFHHEGPTEVTLAYPQMVVLESARKYLQSKGPLEAYACRTLEKAAQSSNELVARKAEAIQKSLGG